MGPSGSVISFPSPQVEREASISYKSRRLPAWCDRILWHSNLPDHMRPRCVRYFMAAEVETSDHKPVGGIFVIPSVNSPAQVVTDVTDSAPLLLLRLLLWSSDRFVNRRGPSGQLQREFCSCSSCCSPADCSVLPTELVLFCLG